MSAEFGPSQQGSNELPRNIVERRYRAAANMDRLHLLRQEVKTGENGLPLFEELVGEGRPGGILYIHPDLFDPFRIQKAYIQKSSVIATRPMIFPTALHQHLWIMDPIGERYGVSTPPISTPHTKELGKNRLHPTQIWELHRKGRALRQLADMEKNGVKKEFYLKELENLQSDWMRKDNLPRAWGLEEYIDEVSTAFKAGGILGLGVQGQRSKVLGEPGIAVRMLFKRIKDVDIDQVVFSFAALDNTAKNDPAVDSEAGQAPHKRGKIKMIKENLFGQWTLRIGDTLTGAQLREEAKVQGISVDAVVFQKLAAISPPSYLGPTSPNSAAA